MTTILETRDLVYSYGDGTVALQGVSICLPPRGREFAGMLHASGRLEIDISRANFNSRGSVAGIAGHQQALPIIANRTELLSGSDIQPPDLLEAPEDLVPKGQARSAAVYQTDCRNGGPCTLGTAYSLITGCSSPRRRSCCP